MKIRGRMVSGWRSAKFWLLWRRHKNAVITTPNLIGGLPLHGSRIKYGCLECSTVYSLRDGEEYSYQMNKIKQNDNPACGRCAVLGREEICQRFAAVTLKAGVGLEEINKNILVLEIKPRNSQAVNRFFESRHSKLRHGTVIREFETREDYPQGVMYDGTDYCTGFHRAKDTMLTYSVSQGGRVYVCLWLSLDIERLLNSAVRVIIYSFKQGSTKNRFEIGLEGPKYSIEKVS